MPYDYRARKIVAVLSETLPSGKALNALGHLAFAAGNSVNKEWMGQLSISDADGNVHHGISNYPFIVLKATPEEIKSIIQKARKENVSFVDYPQEMFDTGMDDELVAALGKASEPSIVYHGILLWGETFIIQNLTGHLKLYR